VTPLGDRLKALIQANGPLSVAEWMAHCLGDPAHGYYTTRDPFGVGGDFVTAPEVSQMFGEIVGAWLCEAWRQIGAPEAVRLVELGPGRGTLMSDILRVAAKAPEFRRALSVHLVETSPALRERQAARLAASGHEIAWHSGFGEVPPGPLLLVANEFFDALPVRQFVRRDGGWQERVIGLDADGRFTFGLGPSRLDPGPDAPDGAVLEVSSASTAVLQEVAARIAAEGGAALVVDYGHTGGFGDTLQALSRHAFADPLAAPGEADLTAHVDFSALARCVRGAGAAAHGPIGQGAFLLSLGLLERAGRLGAATAEAEREAIRAAVERLAGPKQMGELFKLLAITRPGLVPAPFAV
jgi:NADH dehydrogenase [ubiquinone] 1 alpha subcomplex assembly factor 7